MTHLSFATKNEAGEYLSSLGFSGPYNDGTYREPGTYVLSHGEYDRPDFKPVHYKDGWGIKVIPNYHLGTFNAPPPDRVHNFYDDGDCVTVTNYNNGNY